MAETSPTTYHNIQHMFPYLFSQKRKFNFNWKKNWILQWKIVVFLSSLFLCTTKWNNTNILYRSLKISLGVCFINQNFTKFLPTKKCAYVLFSANRSTIFYWKCKRNVNLGDLQLSLTSALVFVQKLLRSVTSYQNLPTSIRG